VYRKLITVGASAGVLALSMVGAAPVSARMTLARTYRRCHAVGQEIIYLNHGVAVFYDVNTSATASYYSACWLASGRRRRFLTEPKNGEPSVEIHQAKAIGSWLYAQTEGSQRLALTFNARTGTKGVRIKVDTSASCTHGNFPLPEDNGFTTLESPLVIGSNGGFAWISQACENAIAPRSLSVYAANGSGHDIVLDTAPEAELRGLRAEGSTVVWEDAGQRHSAPLAGM